MLGPTSYSVRGLWVIIIVLCKCEAFLLHFAGLKGLRIFELERPFQLGGAIPTFLRPPPLFLGHRQLISPPFPTFYLPLYLYPLAPQLLTPLAVCKSNPEPPGLYPWQFSEQ